MDAARHQLKALRQGLADVRSGRLSVAQLSRDARNAHDCLNALPPRFTEVLNRLLDSLESSALFTEESCSFSQNDLLSGLDQWLTQAHHRLDN